MALTDLQRLMVYDTANQLWQQDLLMSAYFQGSTVGANLRSMILGSQPVQPLTNPFDEAITGKLRADSATIRQNARNVSEAASMMGVATEAVGTIKSTLEEMQALAQKVDEGDLTYSTTVGDEYDALRGKIVSIVENTQYNGISLLDSRKWGTSQIDGDGNVHIQAFLDDGFDVTFHALDDEGWGDLQGTQLDEDGGGNLEGQLLTLSTFIGDMTTVEDIYSNRQGGLEYQAAALENQADLMDQAVEARRQTPTLSLEQILLDLLSRDSGTIVDASG
jgi:flagellin